MMLVLVVAAVMQLHVVGAHTPQVLATQPIGHAHLVQEPAVAGILNPAEHHIATCKAKEYLQQFCHAVPFYK